MSQTFPPSSEGMITMPFEESPCACVKTHSPRPLRIERHHVYPQAVQKRQYGKVVDHTLVSLCDTGHKNVHYALDSWLRGRELTLPNRYQAMIAARGFQLILDGEKKTGVEIRGT